jgi:hypothetical protein
LHELLIGTPRSRVAALRPHGIEGMMMTDVRVIIIFSYTWKYISIERLNTDRYAKYVHMSAPLRISILSPNDELKRKKPQPSVTAFPHKRRKTTTDDGRPTTDDFFHPRCSPGAAALPVTLRMRSLTQDVARGLICCWLQFASVCTSLCSCF